MLIGGETAELPGVYQEDELDFAGTCVGIVERDAPDRRLALSQPGDAVVGLPSTGIHANGFSLVRSLVGDDDFDAELTCSRRTGSTSTRCAALRERADVKALAHVTGGGILGNLTRVLPDGLRAQIDWSAGSGRRSSAGSREHGVDEDEAAARVQPRHRLLRRRAGAAGGRARDRRARR